MPDIEPDPTAARGTTTAAAWLAGTAIARKTDTNTTRIRKRFHHVIRTSTPMLRSGLATVGVDLCGILWHTSRRVAMPLNAAGWKIRQFVEFQAWSSAGIQASVVIPKPSAMRLA